MADGFTASFDANSSTLNITWPAYPDAKALEVVSDKMDIGTYNGVMRTGTKRFDYSWISGPIEYKADIMVDGTLVNTISSSKENTTASLTIRPGSSVQVCGYYAYQNSTVNPAKSNTSCVTITAEDASLTLTVPNKNQSFETISAWLDQYGLMYEPTTEAPNSNYENGKSKPNIDILIKFADFYGVSLDYLCEHKTQNRDLGYIDDEQFEAINALKELNHDNFLTVKGYIFALLDNQKKHNS